MWLTHARMTRLMKQGDAAVFGINLLVLLFIGVLPFTTSLMVRNLSGPDTEVAVLDLRHQRPHRLAAAQLPAGLHRA